MRFHYDKQEDALYIRFNEQPYAESDEVEDGIILDYDRRGKIVGMEILHASKKFPRDFTALLLKRKLLLAFTSGSAQAQ